MRRCSACITLGLAALGVLLPPLALVPYQGRIGLKSKLMKLVSLLVGEKLSYLSFSLSAGLGRTGTFIGLDILVDNVLESTQREPRVNVKQCVENMRDQRMKMVQSSVSVNTTFILYKYFIDYVVILHVIFYCCTATYRTLIFSFFMLSLNMLYVLTFFMHSAPSSYSSVLRWNSQIVSIYINNFMHYKDRFRLILSIIWSSSKSLSQLSFCRLIEQPLKQQFSSLHKGSRSVNL